MNAWPVAPALRRFLPRGGSRERPFDARRLLCGEDAPGGRILRWPEHETLWLDENEARHPRSARRVLAALAALAAPDRYAARGSAEARIVTGPVSALLLPDAQAEIQFTARVTQHGYPDG